MRPEDARIEEEIEERYLIDNGLLDPDQPTLQAHRRYNEKAEAPFTPLERRLIRYSLRLLSDQIREKS